MPVMKIEVPIELTIDVMENCKKHDLLNDKGLTVLEAFKRARKLI